MLLLMIATKGIVHMGLHWREAARSRAERSRAEQSRAEQSISWAREE